jgi:hypothetical protein
MSPLMWNALLSLAMAAAVCGLHVLVKAQPQAEPCLVRVRNRRQGRAGIRAE